MNTDLVVEVLITKRHELLEGVEMMEREVAAIEEAVDELRRADGTLHKPRR